MKPTINFNEHLDAQARAYEIGKAEGIEQATAPRACCGTFESCATPCSARANHFKEQRDQLVRLFATTEFRETEFRQPNDYGVRPADIAKISAACQAIRSGKTS